MAKATDSRSLSINFGKTGVSSTLRYTRIQGYLITNNVLVAFVAFVVFVGRHFKKFIVPMQASEPMIHLLHMKMLQLL